MSSLKYITSSTISSKKPTDLCILLTCTQHRPKASHFISINDTLRNREEALKYPLPIILGVEEHLEGTILNYINHLGHISVGFEAGQHDAPSSIENQEAFIWTTLINIGCISEYDILDGHIYTERLAKTTTEGKKIFEVRYKYTINDNEEFTMKPHYVNFQNVKKE